MNETEKSASMQLPPVKQKNRFTIDGSDRIFALSMLILCVAFIAQGLFKGLYFGFSLIFFLIFIAASVYLTKKGERPGVFASVCGGLALAGGAVYTVCTNYVIKLLLIPTLFILCVIWFSALAGVGIPDGDLGVISLLFKTGVADSVVNVPKGAASLAAGEEGKKRKGVKMLIGLLFALPVACIVVMLLADADAAFDEMISGIVERAGAYIGYFVGGLILSAFVIAFCFSLKKTPSCVRSADLSGVDSVYAVAFLGLLSICYLAYLFSQLAYFFSAFKSLLPDGFSTAEYARRGFFELCAVAVINAIVIFAVIVLVRKKETRMPSSVRILSVFISLFTLLLCATSISKMVLYIRTYGLTVFRVGTSAFMLVIAAAFAAMILRMFSAKIKVLQTVVIAASFALLLLGLININSLVAKYNYNAYITGKTKTIDVYTIAEIGSEGIPYLEKLTRAGDKEISLVAAYELYEARYSLYDYKQNNAFSTKDTYPIEKSNRSYASLAAYNVANMRACEVMEQFDFSGYDFQHIHEAYIMPHYDSCYFDEKEQAQDENSTEDSFDRFDFLEIENDINKTVDVIRRGISDGSICAGDEFELVGADKTIKKVEYNDSLRSLKLSDSEKESVGKLLAATEDFYRIKVYSDSIHFYNALSPESDRLIYMLSGNEPAASLQTAEDIVSYYTGEYYSENWYRLFFDHSEQAGG